MSEQVQTTVYPTKRDAMRAGEASGRGYSVDPQGVRDVAAPWVLTIDAAKAQRQTPA